MRLHLCLGALTPLSPRLGIEERRLGHLPLVTQSESSRGGLKPRSVSLPSPWSEPLHQTALSTPGSDHKPKGTGHRASSSASTLACTHTHTHQAHTRTSSSAAKPCQEQLWKGPRGVPGPVPHPYLEGARCPHPQPGHRSQGPNAGFLGACMWEGEVILPWRSPQPVRPVGQLTLLPQSSQHPQAPGQG